ncbi:MAG TPA: DUF6152 family protein, partial [Gammaproteobacteria bacterium]|nr:DUF6152 family protein [Gammaproteobacteria bacterium]
MTARLASAVCGLAALLLAAQSFAAYRELEAKFDKTQPMTFTGIVTNVDWRNPQVHLFVDVKGPDGQVQNWAVELANTIMLRKSGWRSTSVKPGDAVEVQGIVARDGSRQIWGEKVAMAGSGRRVFDVRNTAPIPPEQPRPTPRWPDGVPILGAQDASGGYWAYPTKTVLVQAGVNVAMDRDGLLENVSDAPKVAPFQPWALALYEDRQRRHLRDDPSYLKCEPPGGVRQFQSNLGISFVEDRTRQRIFVLVGSGDRNYRLLYLDGRKPVGQVGGDDNNPLFYG